MTMRREGRKVFMTCERTLRLSATVKPATAKASSGKRSSTSTVPSGSVLYSTSYSRLLRVAPVWSTSRPLLKTTESIVLEMLITLNGQV